MVQNVLTVLAVIMVVALIVRVIAYSKDEGPKAMNPEMLHGQWGIWLYESNMWLHQICNEQIKPRYFLSQRMAQLAADQLWTNHRSRAQIRQFDMSSPDFPQLDAKQDL